jgi:hypothetical protein
MPGFQWHDCVKGNALWRKSSRLVPIFGLNKQKKMKHTDYRDFRGCVSNWKTKLMGLKTAEDWCKTEAYSPCEKCRVCHPKNGKNNFCNGDGLHRIYRGLNVGLVFASLGAVLAAVWAHAINGIVGI